MTKDRTDTVFGLLKWPLVAAVGALQFLCLLYPPTWLGALVAPVALGMATSAQNMLRLLRGDNVMAQPLVESLELGSVLPLSVVFMGLLFSARYTVRQFIRKYTATEDDARKFSECFVRLSYYFLTWLMAYFLAQSEGYFPDISQAWVQFGQGQPRPILVEALYVLQLSYYTGGILVHLLIDQPLKDFWAMLFHHIVTIMLICMSYELGLHRVGVVVLVLHDISDVLLDGAKCFHYISMDALSTITFVNLIISWIMFRLCCYPLFVIQAAMLDVAYLENTQHIIIPMYNVFLWLLGSLLFLHFYWFTLILKVAQRTMADGIEDVRDEDAVKKVAKKSN